MNKASLLHHIVERLSENLATLEKAARAAHDEATHESSKAESKYDTRGLEAAYLAGGQARMAREILEAIKTYRELPPRDFGPRDMIDVGAFVSVEVDRQRSDYFIGPSSGGLEVGFDQKEVTVITPQSPLGKQLMGRKQSDRWSVKDGRNTVRYEICEVR